MTAIRKTFAPLDHHNYDDLDESCDCKVCIEWRDRRDTYYAMEGKVDGRRHGSITACRCQGCKDIRRARSAYIVSNARRDLFSEASYHASGKVWGPALMEWVEAQLVETPKRTRGWWEARASDLPLSYWFGKFNAFALEVSGVVPIRF